METFERLESNVRSYCRSFPTVFDKARGALLYDERGREYIDFFAGAGVMSYGHNNPRINQALRDYIAQDGIIHSLDMFTKAKREFLEALDSIILRPRGLEYRVQFCGPTGANAAEAALKLARKTKQRRGVIAFTNAYHGLSMGALAATGNRHYHNEFYPCDMSVAFMPYDGYLGPEVDTTQVLRRYLCDTSSGVGVPAAIILETIQAEGGVNVAGVEWLREIEGMCREFGAALIVDDIQVGNGRSGDFFSFERAGLQPDMVIVSKAIGAGLPMAILLIKPELDTWGPGQHTGTFRGNDLAFVGAVQVLEYWRTKDFSDSIKAKAGYLRQRLEALQARHSGFVSQVRGCGMIQGLVMPQAGACAEVSREAFRRGVIIELAGPSNEVLKFLPPLTIDTETLGRGVEIIEEAIAAVAA
jgi:diaminobutyrate-2-oxoglutarate transaminase